MDEQLIIIPHSYKDAPGTRKHIALIERSLGEARVFYYHPDNVLELKGLLAGGTFSVIVVCFLALDQEFPELQAVRSLALRSATVVYCPALNFIKGSQAGSHAECDLARWYDIGKTIQLNACRQADLVIVEDGAERDLLGAYIPVERIRTAAELCPADIPRVRRDGKTTSIIILSFNQLAETRQCVESLRRHTQARYELIFVDNGSLDGSREYLEQLKVEDPSITVICNDTNRGFAAANNQGIACATGDYVLLLNNDVILTEGWLERMITCLESDPQIGVVGPCTNRAVGKQVIATACAAADEDIQKFACLQTLANAGAWFETHRIIGFCFLMKRKVIDTVGVLDERFGPGGYEDYDYCLRIRQAGYKIMVASDIFIYHIGGHGYAKNKLDYDKLRAQNIEIFIDKWSRKAIEILDAMPDGL